MWMKYDEALWQADCELRSGAKDVGFCFLITFSLLPLQHAETPVPPSQDRLSFSSGSAVARGWTSWIKDVQMLSCAKEEMTRSAHVFICSFGSGLCLRWHMLVMGSMIIKHERS